jgi:hypothetical protein
MVIEQRRVLDASVGERQLVSAMRPFSSDLLVEYVCNRRQRRFSLLQRRVVFNQWYIVDDGGRDCSATCKQWGYGFSVGGEVDACLCILPRESMGSRRTQLHFAGLFLAAARSLRVLSDQQ